ncbi:DNA polymerase alpha subunit B N-terminal-domain-containing protein [Chlamydoabsidia padenii]|nr:DNA polymerase alpha subunit B N-terminal-domain-containing protein [Chlamydoabsidia padenii]
MNKSVPTIATISTIFNLDQKEHSDVLLELESLCRLYSLSAEDLKFKWEAFSFNKKNAKIPTVELVRQLKTTIQHKFEQTLQPNTSQVQRNRLPMKQQQQQNQGLGLNDFMDIDGAQDPVDDFLSKLTGGGSNFGYTATGTTSRDAPKNLAPVPPTLNLEQSQTSTPYRERAQTNVVDTQYNPQLSFPSKDDQQRQKAVIQFMQPPIEKYRYMFEKIRNKAEVLDDRIDYMAQVISQAYGLENDYGNPTRATQDTITAVGRICSDSSEGKLNDKSILLETSRTLGMGKRVKLDMSNTIGYSLFPGQIVAVEGTNKTGKSFSVEKILLPPFPDTINNSILDNNQSPNTQVTEVIIATGPYTLDSDLSFDPLQELLVTCHNEQPHVLILMGPFLSVGHPFITNGRIDQLPENIFRSQISVRLNQFAQSSPNMQILMMPHADDIIQEWPLFPQPSMQLDSLNVMAPNIRSISNPSILDINGSAFAFANVDILLSLGNQEINKNAHVDRMANLSRHILQQQNFYPLFPTSMTDSIDADQMAYLQLAVKPDLLVLPSQLKHFAKLVDDVLCINPGHLCKGRSGGTFARLAIHPNSSTNPSPTHTRTRIDLIKI